MYLNNERISDYERYPLSQIDVHSYETGTEKYEIEHRPAWTEGGRCSASFPQDREDTEQLIPGLLPSHTLISSPAAEFIIHNNVSSSSYEDKIVIPNIKDGDGLTCPSQTISEGQKLSGTKQICLVCHNGEFYSNGDKVPPGEEYGACGQLYEEDGKIYFGAATHNWAPVGGSVENLDGPQLFKQQNEYADSGFDGEDHRKFAKPEQFPVPELAGLAWPKAKKTDIGDYRGGECEDIYLEATDDTVGNIGIPVTSQQQTRAPRALTSARTCNDDPLQACASDDDCDDTCGPEKFFHSPSMLPIHKKPVCFPRALGNCTDVSMRIDEKTCHDDSKNFLTDTSDEETCHDLEQHVYRGFETKLDGTGKLLVYFPYVETLQNEDDKEDQDTRNFELTEARIDVLLGKDETIELPKLKGISHNHLQNKIATAAARNNALTSVKRDIVRKDPEIYDDSGEIIEDDWDNLPLAPETLRQEVVDKYKNEIENYTYNYLQWSNPLLKYQYEIRRYEDATSKRVKDLGDGDLDDREAFSQIHYDKGYFPLSNQDGTPLHLLDKGIISPPNYGKERDETVPDTIEREEQRNRTNITYGYYESPNIKCEEKPNLDFDSKIMTWCKSEIFDEKKGFAQKITKYDIDYLRDESADPNELFDRTTNKCKEVCDADYDCEGLVIRGYPKHSGPGPVGDGKGQYPTSMDHGCWLLKNVNKKGLIPSETQESMLFDLKFDENNDIVPADETTPTILNEVIMIKEVNGIPDLRHGQGISAPFGLDEYCMGLVDNLSLAEAPQTCNSDESCTWHFQSKIGEDLTHTHSLTEDVNAHTFGNVGKNDDYNDDLAGSWACRAKPLVDVQKKQCFCSNSGQTVFNPKMVVEGGENGGIFTSASSSIINDSGYQNKPAQESVTQFQFDFGNAPFYTQSWEQNGQWLL